MEITDDQVIAAEEIASDVYDQAITLSKGAELLHSVHRLNINSARDFINDYRQMMRGRVFQRAMSSFAIDYFLTKILEKRGEKSHALAISACDQHIDYIKQLNGTSLVSMARVVDAHRRKARPIELSDQLSQFEQEVQNSLRDSQSARLKRLKSAPKMPTKVLVTAHAFVRNPDVVAEVLARANGQCEHCHKPAPFVRKRDGLPYLEVHHVHQLSKGGADTVENAKALCPNCHRFLHYGSDD